MGTVLPIPWLGNIFRLGGHMFKPTQKYEIKIVESFYTHMDMGMNSVAEQYGKYLGVERGYRRPWTYEWDINWLARY